MHYLVMCIFVKSQIDSSLDRLIPIT